MTANIFISFASKDVKMAMTLCTALENRGYKCWISARDIQPGENFQVAIVQAIRHAKIMLLVFTANSNNSEEMTKELALASQQKMIVIPLRVEDVTPSDAFAYEFATRQWIDFFADWEFAIEQLARRIANALRDRTAGIEGNEVVDALNEVAANAPVAYTIEAPKPEAKAEAAKAETTGAPSKSALAPAAAPPDEKSVQPPTAKSAAAVAATAAPTPVPAPPQSTETSRPASTTATSSKPGIEPRKLALIIGVAVVVLTGVSLMATKVLMRPRLVADPVQAAKPVQVPTVVEATAPTALVPGPASASLTTNSATNAATSSVDLKVAPKKKPKAAPKDDIPF